MTQLELDRIIVELDAWKRRERHGRLTWQLLEDKFGYSRQTLATKPAIVELYAAVKSMQKRGTKVKPPKTADERVAVLNAEIAHLRRTLDAYDERFERILYWANSKGIDVNALIQPLPARHRQSEGRYGEPGRVARYSRND